MGSRAGPLFDWAIGDCHGSPDGTCAGIGRAIQGSATGARIGACAAGGGGGGACGTGIGGQ